jgi:hypothetical protein
MVVNPVEAIWDPHFAESWGNSIGTEPVEKVFTFTSDVAYEDAVLIIDGIARTINQGQEPLVITIHSLSLSVQASPVSQIDGMNVKEDGFMVAVGDMGVATLTAAEGVGTLDVSNFSDEIWELIVRHANIALVPNKTYQLSYTLTPSINIGRYEFIARTDNQNANGLGFYIWSDVPGGVSANTPITRTFTFTTSDDVENFSIFFQFGGAASVPGVITFNNFSLKYFDGNETNSLKWSSLPEGFYSYDDASSEASLYIDTTLGALVYDIEVFGESDWQNKVWYDLSFNEGSKYQIIIEAYATRDISFNFIINVKSEWNPKVYEQINLTTEAQSFTFETLDIQTLTQYIELLFQFGQVTDQPCTIYITSITIVELAKGGN